VLFLYGVNLCSYALAGVFFFCPTQWLSKHIRTGDFNDIFIRPVNSLWNFICKYINLDYVSHISLSVTTMVICIIKLGIKVTFVKICFLLLTLVSAAVIQGSAMMIFSIPQIKWINGNVSRIFFYAVKRITDYPLSIYSKTIQFLLTYVFPYAFISFYPSQYFIGKNDFLFFHPYIQFFSPVVAAILFTIMIAFWNKGINWYQGTGT